MVIVIRPEDPAAGVPATVEIDFSKIIDWTTGVDTCPVMEIGMIRWTDVRTDIPFNPSDTIVWTARDTGKFKMSALNPVVR